MTALIDPFTLNPTGPFDPLANYWFSTWCRIIYQDDLSLLQDLAAVTGAGENDVEVFAAIPLNFGDVIPRVEVIHAPAGDLVQIRGTFPQSQLMAEILYAALVERIPWPGRVMRYLADRTLQVYAAIEESVSEPAILCGHSLGGAIAGMLSTLVGVRVWTEGAPREGNAAYANVHNHAAKLRLANAEDLVPTLPPHTTTDYGRWAGIFLGPIPAPSTGYRHWGTTWRLLGNFPPGRGGVDMPSPDDYDLFVRQALLTNNWLVPHHVALYAQRIRQLIPVRFPAAGPDFAWPGLHELDLLSVRLNELENVTWTLDGRDSLQIIVGGDAWRDQIQEYNDGGRYLEELVYPFRCPGELDQ